MTIGPVSFAAVPLPLPNLPGARAGDAQAAAAAQHFGQAAPGLVQDIEAAAARLMGDAATAALAATSEGHTLPPGAPELRDPDMALVYAALPDEEGARRMTPEALFTALVGELMETIQKSDLERLKAQAQVARDAMAQQQAAYERVIEALSGAQATLDEDLQAATEAGEESQRRMTLAAEGAERVDTLQAALDAMSSDDPERPHVTEQLEAAKRELQSLRSDAETAARTFLEATDKVAASQQEVNGHLAEVDEIRKLVLPGLAFPERSTNNAELTKLIALLSTVVTEANRAKVQFEANVAMEKLKQQQAENTRRAEEHQKKVDEAAAISKGASCAARIAMWIGVAFMSVMGVLTGGATLAVAGVFLGMLLAKEVGGVDVLGAVMNPIIEEILMPIGDFVGKLIAKMMILTGHDEEYANKIGSYVGMAYAMWLMVGTVVVGGMLAKALIGKLISTIGPMLAKFAAKALGTMMAAMAKVAAQAAAVSAKLAIPKAAVYAAKAQVVATVVQLGAQAGTAGAHIAADVQRLDAAKLLADVLLGIQQSEVVQEHLRQIHDDSARVGEFINALLESMSDIGRNAANSNVAIAANFRAA